MDKKRKWQLAIIVILMVLLIGFLVFVIGKSVYDFTTRTKESHAVVERFDEIYKKKGTQVVLFASPSCKWCKKFVPVLTEISKENNFEYIYLDMSMLFQEDLKKIYDKIKIEYKGIPHLIILKDGKVIGSQVGAQEKEDTIELLKNAGVIEGDVEDGESISTSS